MLDRETSNALCKSVSDFIRKRNYRGVVFASCHYDMMESLRPDWVRSALTRILL